MKRSLDFILRLIGNHETIFSQVFFLLELGKLIPGWVLCTYSYLFPLTINVCMAGYLSFQVYGKRNLC